MAFELSFVDSIAASPTTRLDLNDGTNITTLLEGTDFGTPQLERAFAGTTLLVDGSPVPASKYSNRIITLHLELADSSKDTAATHLQSIARELNRAVNILRYKPDTTNPVFFRCMRSNISSVIWDAVQSRATVTILAEPFAYGTKQTLSAATVNNDPAAGSNGMFFDVTGVLGDVETPLNLQVTRGTSPTLNGHISCVSVRRRGTPSSMPFVLQAESMTADTDTSIQANSATFSGAGQNYMRCTFATDTSMVTRVHSSLYPGTASVDARGRYRVFARVRKTNALDSVKIRLGYGAGTVDFGWESNLNDEVSLAQGTTSPVWLDLGVVAIPVGGDPVYDGYSNTEVAAGGIGVSLQAQRVSGSGNLDIDVLLFMPADDRLAFVEYGDVAVSGLDYEIIDSVHDRLWTQEASAVFSMGTATAGKFVGGLPMVSPGVTNRICWLLASNGDTKIDDLTYTAEIVPFYWPRYLYVRPLST